MDLPEPKFKALISEYLLILGSKYIDDESLYLKHLQKQAQLQNTHALRQLSILQQFDAITKDIQSQITDITHKPPSKEPEQTCPDLEHEADAPIFPRFYRTLIELALFTVQAGTRCISRCSE